MEERAGALGIQVAMGPDADAEEVAEATLQLRRELLDLDVEAVELLRADEAPPGTRGLELAALGALVVTVSSASRTSETGPRHRVDATQATKLREISRLAGVRCYGRPLSQVRRRRH